MSQTRLFSVSLLAMLAVSLAASAQAFAIEHHYVVEGTEISSKEKLALEGSSKAFKLAGDFKAAKATVQCEKDSLSGSFEESGKSKKTIEYKGCKLYKGTGTEIEKEAYSGCKINEPITAKIHGTLTGREESESQEPVEEKLTPEATEFTKVEVTENGKEKCSEGGKYTILGSQLCKLPNAEEELSEQQLECLPSGGKLKLETENASLTNTNTIKLKTTENFAATQQARISFNWRVNNAGLLNGEASQIGTMGLTAGTNLTIVGTTKGERFELECTEVLRNGNAFVVGNLVNQGYMEGRLEIKGCTVTAPTGCTITTPIVTEFLYGVIFEGRTTAVTYNLGFYPSTVNVRKLFGINFKGAGCGTGGQLNNVTVNIVVPPNRGACRQAGLLAELPGGMGGQEIIQKLSFEPTENLHTRALQGVLCPAGLRIEGEETNKVTVKGKVTMELASGFTFGPY
jgi:hypothetical protein